jgi:hypothetical protein
MACRQGRRWARAGPGLAGSNPGARPCPAGCRRARPRLRASAPAPAPAPDAPASGIPGRRHLPRGSRRALPLPRWRRAKPMSWQRRYLRTLRASCARRGHPRGGPGRSGPARGPLGALTVADPAPPIQSVFSRSASWMLRSTFWAFPRSAAPRADKVRDLNDHQRRVALRQAVEAGGEPSVVRFLLPGGNPRAGPVRSLDLEIGASPPDRRVLGLAVCLSQRREELVRGELQELRLRCPHPPAPARCA